MLLPLLHLADSALPVGAAAHSFGLETMVQEECLRPEGLAEFLREYLSEAGVLEASFVRRAWRCGVAETARELSDEFGARRVARESREASLKMGRRFSRLVNACLGAKATPAIPEDFYYPVAFGLAGARLEIPELETAVAYLRQSLAGLVSACQRLMPVGQVEASCLIWNLHPFIQRAAEMVGQDIQEIACFTPLVELASARHGSLDTRLFIS